MNIVKDRTHRVNVLIEQVKEHCMCSRFEDDGAKFRVIYPEGYFPDGVQCSQRIGKAAALERILAVMERHWKESFF